jgi:hypothetical protein
MDALCVQAEQLLLQHAEKVQRQQQVKKAWRKAGRAVIFLVRIGFTAFKVVKYTAAILAIVADGGASLALASAIEPVETIAEEGFVRGLEYVVDVCIDLCCEADVPSDTQLLEPGGDAPHDVSSNDAGVDYDNQQQSSGTVDDWHETTQQSAGIRHCNSCIFTFHLS